MSGWMRGYSCAAFGLTATKGAYWHHRVGAGVAQCTCGAYSLSELFARHLEPRGFERLRSPSPNLLVLTRDDLVARPRYANGIHAEGPIFAKGPIFDALQALP